MTDTQQIERTTDALVTAANLDTMLTSAHSQIQRITTERDALRKALTKIIRATDGSVHQVKAVHEATSLLKGQL